MHDILRSMKHWIAAWMVAGVALAPGQDAPAEAPAQEVTDETPSVEDAIPPTVKALETPAAMAFPGGLKMAVTATTEEAQNHVVQGLNHLHGGWEFEASRHFAAAIREDPECLLAHWGMVMSLLTPSPETGPARNAATDRLLDLIDAGNGNELERGYAYGLVKYMEEGPVAAAEAFRKVSERFPNDMQAGIFAALFGRGGYDDFGTPTPDQEKAEAALLALIEKNPESTLPLHALLSIRAEGGDLRESLPLARKLCQMAPGYAPYYHVLGHFEWRTGGHGRAASAFGRASALLDAWMKENKATVADCPEWVKAECYRVVALASKGDFDTAYMASRQLAGYEFPADRASSPGARLLMWDAWTLPTRLLMRRGLPGNTAEALASLPKPDTLKKYRDNSLAHWWVDGLRMALESKRQMEAGDLEGARATADALTHHGEQMSRMQLAAVGAGERSSWTRAFRALEVVASELRGRIALGGPKEGHGSAYNWFRSAADRQLHSTMMQPPTVLAPMQLRLGEYYLAMNRPADALEVFEEGLARFPNDMDSLQGLKRAAELAGEKEKAEAAAEQIRGLEAE